MPALRPSASAPAVEKSTALVRCGPVVGKVTSHSAIILLEVDEDAVITAYLTPRGDRPQPGAAGLTAAAARAASLEVAKENEVQPHRLTLKFKGGHPKAFCFQALDPDTLYDVTFDGLATNVLDDVRCLVKTTKRSKDITKLKFVAVSCDRVERLGEKDENPWGRVHKIVETGECDAVLHLGDQVYTSQWGYLTRAYNAMEHYNAQTTEVQAKMKHRALEYLRDAYRDTWTFQHLRHILAQSQHMMIWSDNDVANDFTVLRDEGGEQAYTPEFLTCGMKVYREYQRQLWDPKCEGKLPKKNGCVEEWQFRRFGPCGIFLIDMRGNRITPTGCQVPSNPILSPQQRKMLREVFQAEEGLSCLIICAEIPFVGDDPVSIREKIEAVPFLVDHWPYNIEELLWLLDLCFNWKAGGTGREVILIGGDIHVGVESDIKDAQTGLTIKHITASPITNHVCAFFPKLDGKLSERYSYSHRVLPEMRNYCTIDLEFDRKSKEVIKCDAVLHGVPTHAMATNSNQKGPKEKEDPVNDHTQLLRFQTVGFASSECERENLTGTLVVKVGKAVGLPKSNKMEALKCFVKLGGGRSASTYVATNKDQQNPKWNHTLKLKYYADRTMRVKVEDSLTNTRIGAGDFPLSAFLRGWKNFSGCIPIFDTHGRETGAVHLSVDLKTECDSDSDS